MKKLGHILMAVAVISIVLPLAAYAVKAQEVTDPFQTSPTYTITPKSEPTPTPIPTPTPTPKIVPGSPLSVGSANFHEFLSQLDIMGLAQIVMVGLGLMWFIIISVIVAKKLLDKMSAEKEA
jgi:hypothetical protein